MEKLTEDRVQNFYIVKIFAKVDRVLQLGIKAIEAVHYGLWLGLLNRVNLDRISEQGYLALSIYTNSTYNLQGLSRWEEIAVKNFFNKTHSILLGAAGGGREIYSLNKLGFQIDAFESSPVYVQSCTELLKNEGIQSEVVVAPPSEVPESFGIYDGLILGWAAYTHIQGRLARIEFLRNFSRHVRPGGPLLISFWDRPTQDRQLDWAYHIASSIRRIRNCSESIELGDYLDKRSLFGHYFTELEVRSELEEAGFKCIFYSEHGFGHAVGIAHELNV